MNPEAIKSICKSAALVAVSAGTYGMLLCTPYIMGNDVVVIAAASLPFIAGAILVAGGMVSFTLLIKKELA
jgi:hypothetical protein